MQWVTFAIAVLGATLGMFNAWWSVRKDMAGPRVRAAGMSTNTGLMSVGIEVSNVGYIPVTIAEMGFISGRFAKQKMVATDDALRRIILLYRRSADGHS